MMKKYLLIFLFAIFFLPSCKQETDLRYIAPQVEFAAGQYDLDLEKGTYVDVFVELSRPASKALEMNLIFGGTLQEGVHYSASSDKVLFTVGASSAKIRLTMRPDAIMDAESTIDIMFEPGDYYAISPNLRYKTVVRVQKAFDKPILKLVSSENTVLSNPFLQETIPMAIESHIPVRSDLSVGLTTTGLALGADLLINGTTTAELVIPAGQTRVEFNLRIAFKDQSGYAKDGRLSLSPGAGYQISGSSGSLTIQLSDPVVDFSKLLKTAALQSGAGYQVRQAFKTRENAWDGSTTVDLGVSSTGSNYLRNYRNMYNHPSFSCMANSATSQLLRMSELFPNYLYPNPTAILDYGNDQGHREFSPADSVFRFVPLPDNPQKGTVLLKNPRSFLAYIGSYADWQDKSSGENAWIRDSRATNGMISASTHPAITGSITLVLEKVEGTYDFSNSNEPVVLSAWFSSPSDQLMAGFDKEKYAVEQENGLWKVQYKLWPR